MESILTRTRSLARRLVYVGGDETVRELRREVRRLTETLQQLEHAHGETAQLARRVDRISSQLRMLTLLNRRDRQEVARIAELLDEGTISEHVGRAVAAASLLTDPYEHAVVEGVLPEPVYDLLVRAIPPPAFFDDRDPIKQNLTFPMELGPELSERVWHFADEVIAQRVIRGAVLEKFREPLNRHLASTFGPEFVERAASLPQSTYGGRLMLRRPGYHLAPHRDPKRAMLTCLLYLAREGDSEAYGTQIFRVLDDGEAEYKQTYYPEQDGRTCELVKVVPFRRNTMLVFVNSRGAHGAHIPADAPSDLERYSYQFYVAPQNEALRALLKSLASEGRARWRSKELVRPLKSVRSQ